MTFTLQDFYIESVTAHKIETKIKTSLRARVFRGP